MSQLHYTRFNPMEFDFPFDIAYERTFVPIYALLATSRAETTPVIPRLFWWDVLPKGDPNP